MINLMAIDPKGNEVSKWASKEYITQYAAENKDNLIKVGGYVIVSNFYGWITLVKDNIIAQMWAGDVWRLGK